MDVMIPLVAIVATLVTFRLGRALGAFPITSNFEGKAIPVAGAAAGLGILAGLQWEHSANSGLPWYAWAGTLAAARIAILAFGALGYVDDRWGDRSASGFSGHIRAALRGRVTTGFLKMVGGGATALLCGYMLRRTGWVADSWLWLLKAAVIALSANAVNLLDTRPVRAALVFLGLAGATLLLGDTREPAMLAGIGAALAWLPLDRRHVAMLGDAGSNVLGAFWGVIFVAYAGWEAVVAALALLVAFHIYAERRSLNADIARVPVIRRMDEWIRG